VVTIDASKHFSHLPETELNALRQIARERTYAAGQEIFKEGDTGDGVYVVKDGLVEISGIVGQNVRKAFSQVGAGDIFGEMAIIENKARSASATATRDTVVYFIPQAEMIALMERSPALALELLREISSRLREFNRHYINEVLQTERLAIVGRFARSIVHDLKNPLHIIGMTAEIAVMEKTTPAVRQQAQTRIRKQVERISDLIGEILEFTQGSNTDFVLAPTSYAAFVREALEELRPEAEMRAASIELEGSLPEVKVLAHPKRLRRVFINLIHNATDAMPKGGKILLRFDLSGPEVITEIEDSGPGIAPQIADTLFEAFATYGKTHGTGLGLSICKRIIEDHHGRMWARNQPGRGAVFAFTLPLARMAKKEVT
jgi:signal transduction histidine kinase